MSASVITVLVISLIALVLLLLCGWFAGRLYRLIVPPETSAAMGFLALGLTLFLWPAPIRATFSALYSLVRQLLLLPFLYDAEVAWRDFAEQGSVFHALNKLLPNANNLLADVDRIPFFQLLLSLIALVLLVRGLSAVSQGQAGQWIERLRGVRPTLWLNSLVLIIFFAGIYFSVASLCTIPMLQVNQPFTEAERAQIKTQIDAYTPSEDAFNKQFPENPPESVDQLVSIRGLLTAAGEKIDPSCSADSKPMTPEAPPAAATNATAAPAASAAQPKPVEAAADLLSSEAAILHGNTQLLTQVKSFLQGYDHQRCDQLAAYRAMRSEVLKSEQTEAGKVKSQVDSNFGLRLIGRERASYTYNLQADYEDYVSRMHADLNGCKSAIARDSPIFSDYSHYIEFYLRTAVTDPTATVLPFQFGSYASSAADHASLCQIDPIGRYRRSQAPAPQLGVFSFLFGWLENSDSLALAIICGMLGVGLVGCIVSSFLRQQAATAAAGATQQAQTPAVGAPWIPDIFRVIVLSFTAAIVVYLAIEGGLNIFSTENNQANPYVLLFSCLIGAVFSQNVWDAAHDKLLAAIKQLQEQRAKAAAETPAKPAAPAGATGKSGATPPAQ